jgi:hypothetical protein
MVHELFLNYVQSWCDEVAARIYLDDQEGATECLDKAVELVSQNDVYASVAAWQPGRDCLLCLGSISKKQFSTRFGGLGKGKCVHAQ